jgi:hypothetical protein
VVVAVSPLIIGPQEDFGGGRQALRFMEQPFQGCDRVHAVRR